MTAPAPFHIFYGDVAAGNDLDGNDHNIQIRTDGSSIGNLFFVGGPLGTLALGGIRYDHSADIMDLRVNASTSFRVHRSGVLATGAFAAGSGTNKIVFGNGIAPTTNIANAVQLYSEDVLGSAELKVRDEAGNVTVLSPHGFGLRVPSEPMAWCFCSERAGRGVFCDIMAAMREIEWLSERVRGAGLGRRLIELYDDSKDRRRSGAGTAPA